MKDTKRWIDKLLHPPAWFLCTVPTAVFALLIHLFVTGRTRGLPVYLLYGLSAYSLAVWCCALPRAAAACRRRKAGWLEYSPLCRRLSATRFGGRFFSSAAFRSEVGICGGMLGNFAYMLFRGVTGILYHSVWSFSAAVYYLGLGLLRAYLLRSFRHAREQGDTAAEYISCRRTARCLFLLDIPMGGMILLMVVTNAGYRYPNYVIYISALYTLVMFGVSIRNLFRSRRLGSPILSAARALSFVAAVMSVLCLQTAMIARFAGGREDYRRMMNTITGSCVYLIVIGTAVYMLAVLARAVYNTDKEGSAEPMNRSESKYFHTAEKMDKAFLMLLEKKDFEYITVKEICEAAGVNRSTFYLHYETIGDLLEESVRHMTEQFLAYMQRDASAFITKIKTCPVEELHLVTPEYLTPYLGYIKENRRLLCTVLKNAAALRLEDSYKGLRQYVLIPIMERFGVPEADRDYLMAYYISGLMAVVRVWLERDCADPIDRIIAVMQRCAGYPFDR